MIDSTINKSKNDALFMGRALQLAKNGIGTTRPNPSVGAVITFENKIIGEGFTSVYGGNHAEVNAINSVKNKELLKDATIYVTLEPCSHFGKTPPCADLILTKKISRVVIGCIDTNSIVAGAGVERLKKAGCIVDIGVLEEACKLHHKRFFTVHNKERPYIILKWAVTKDGFIAPRLKKKQKPVWITNQYSQQLVHKWRAQEHAILVGTNTVLKDNPSLTVRSWTGNNPTRIVLDQNSRIFKEATVFDGKVRTIVLVGKSSESKKRIEQENVLVIEIDYTKNIASEICKALQKYKIQSIIIEGGTQTLQSFINENLWDEVRVFTGDTVFNEGVKQPIFKNFSCKTKTLEHDTLDIYQNTKA